jgi:hypothetical protein
MTSAFAQLAPMFWEIFGAITPTDGYPEVDYEPGEPLKYRSVGLGGYTLWGSLKGSKSRFFMIVEHPDFPTYAVSAANKAFARVELDVGGVTMFLARPSALRLTVDILARLASEVT